jgi:polyferredoxin
LKNKKFVKNLRWIILGAFLLFITFKAYLHGAKGGGEAASIHALCPYGGLESLYNFMAEGTFIKKIFSGTFVLLVLTLIVSILFRRSFCGLICPFGALQEFFGIIGMKVFRVRFTMAESIDKPLRYLKYIILLLTLIFAWSTAGLWVSPYDPWSTYAHISEGIGTILAESPIGLILLILTVIGSILYDRFFCKYLCPMGAFYGILSRFSFTKIVRNEDKCINCKICDKKCPVNLQVSNCSVIKSPECINCQSCILSCPREGALEVKTFNKSLKPLAVILSVLFIFFGGIYSFQKSGLYKTVPDAIPVGTVINIDDIKGYMTIEEVAQYIDTDIKELYLKLSIPDIVPKTAKMKEISSFIPGFEVDKAKEILK